MSSDAEASPESSSVVRGSGLVQDPSFVKTSASEALWRSGRTGGRGCRSRMIFSRQGVFQSNKRDKRDKRDKSIKTGLFCNLEA